MTTVASIRPGKRDYERTVDACSQFVADIQEGASSEVGAMTTTSRYPEECLSIS